MQKIFSEFPPNTAADWKNQLMKDLKGEAYETLIWQNDNGFEVQPFYTAEDLKQTYEPAFTHANWDVCVQGKSFDSKELNKQLLGDLQRGANSISVHCAKHNLSTVLNGIQLNYIQSTFFVNENNVVELKNYLEKNYALNELNCSLFPEKLENKEDLENWSKTLDLFEEFKNIKTLSFDALGFHNLNCLAYYEVALIFSGLIEQLDYFAAKKNVDSFKPVIKTGVSSDFFIQIAKLRAIRRLWSILKKEYNCTAELQLIIETGLTNKSISDSYNNLLRTTVEAMAAVAGGCDELIVTEFDTLFASNNTLSERMAINQQLILKEESYLDKMADIACGSYYIESMTDALASKALDTFKRFEKEGGYFKCIEKDIFSTEITTQAKKRADLINTKKQISIGINTYRNEKEQVDIPASALEELKHLAINNPVLNFELEHFFK